MDQTGKWKLAPAYDVCHTYRQGSDWVSQHKLSINGKRKDFFLADFMTITEQNSIRNAKKIVCDCVEIVSNWKTFSMKYDVHSELSEDIKKTLILKILTN